MEGDSQIGSRLRIAPDAENLLPEWRGREGYMAGEDEDSIWVVLDGEESEGYIYANLNQIEPLLPSGRWGWTEEVARD